MAGASRNGLTSFPTSTPNRLIVKKETNMYRLLLDFLTLLTFLLAGATFVAVLYIITSAME